MIKFCYLLFNTSCLLAYDKKGTKNKFILLTIMDLEPVNVGFFYSNIKQYIKSFGNVIYIWVNCYTAIYYLMTIVHIILFIKRLKKY